MTDDDQHDRDVVPEKEEEEEAEHVEELAEAERVRQEEQEEMTGDEDLERRNAAEAQENPDNHRDEEPFQS